MKYPRCTNCEHYCRKRNWLPGNMCFAKVERTMDEFGSKEVGHVLVTVARDKNGFCGPKGKCFKPSRVYARQQWKRSERIRMKQLGGYDGRL